MKITWIYLTAILFALAIACSDGKEGPEPPYEPVTIELSGKDLPEIKEAIKGSWMWYSGEFQQAYYLGSNSYYTLGTCEPILDCSIIGCTFKDESIILYYKDGCCEDIDNFRWGPMGLCEDHNCFGLHFGSLSGKDAPYRMYDLAEIQNDTLMVFATTAIDNELRLSLK